MRLNRIGLHHHHIITTNHYKAIPKITFKKAKSLIEGKYLFGFRQINSLIDHVHLMMDVIENTLKEKLVCSTIFLDVTQTFDKV